MRIQCWIKVSAPMVRTIIFKVCGGWPIINTMDLKRNGVRKQENRI